MKTNQQKEIIYINYLFGIQFSPRLLCPIIQDLWKKNTPFNWIFSVIPTKNKFKEGIFGLGHPKYTVNKSNTSGRKIKTIV